MVSAFRADERVRDMFSDLNPFTSNWLGAEPFTRSHIENSLLAFKIAVDGASLILAHSVLDGVIDLLCRTSIAVEPAQWSRYVRDKTFRLQDLEKATSEQLRDRALRQFITTLSREAILVKLDRLFKAIKPTSEQLGAGTRYRFSRDRLERLDKLRHTLVHGTAPPDKVTMLYHIERWKNIDDDLEYLSYTPVKLTVMVGNHYQLSMSPIHLLP